LFEAKGSVTKQAGWRAVFGEAEESVDNESSNLPELFEGETLPILNAEVLEKQTKPKPLHTESSLLGAMESCGKDISDEAEREAIKDCGIGTPATRAAIIETLFARDYIRRDKKSLVPTEKGLSVYETVKDKQIADVALTGNWENALLQIENGKMLPETFKNAIEIFTRQITKELLETSITPSFGGGQGEVTCPKCKSEKIRFFPKVVKCADPNCGLVIFRNKSEKELSDKQITDLLTTGKTSVIKGFKNKDGKSFDSALKFDEKYQVIFDKNLKKGKK